jgi:hypothetical protein
MDRHVALLVGLLCILPTAQNAESAGLVYDYYKTSCPQAEKIIHDTVFQLYEKKGNIATSLIRYVFHDCFNVRNRSNASIPFHGNGISASMASSSMCNLLLQHMY